MQETSTCKAAVPSGAASQLQLLKSKKKTYYQLLRPMKLTAIILLTSCIQITARGLTQAKVSLSEKNAPLEKIFRNIERQTDYTFFYSESWIQRAKNVTIEVKNLPIEQVLDLCFKDQPLTYSISGKTISVRLKEAVRINSLVNNAIESGTQIFIDVKGKVLNENGDPVEGVSVGIKGTSVVTITNRSGEFSLSSVDPEAILVFTHISLETFELKVSGKTELAISLRTKVNALGDVTVTVSTGYQDVPKERATGSFYQIDNSTLNRQVGTNILKRLDGVSSGVQFDTKNPTQRRKTNLSIRGLSTINGPLDPLVVLDGFVYEGGIENINPNIIESITILKDAAASSIWGTRAGNGVIVITSKKGKFNQKLQVDFNSTITVGLEPNFNYLREISVDDYIGLEEYLFNKGYFNSTINSTSKPGLSPAVEIFLKRKTGVITSDDSASQINALKSIDSRDEYLKHFYTNSLTQQYAVNFRGGSNNNAYAFSAGYDRSLNELHSQYNKLNIRFENTFRPISNLQLNFAVYFTNSRANSGRPSYNSITINGRRVPYLKFADDDGNPVSVSVNRDGYIDTAGSGKLLDWRFYPGNEYKHNISSNNLEEIFANMGLQYKIFKFLNFELKYQYQRQNGETIGVQDLESFAARNVINTFSQLNRSTGVVTYIVPKGSIRTVNEGTTKSQTGRAQLNLNHFWKNHAINAIVGSEIREARNFGNSYTAYGYNDDPLTTGNVDFVNRYPTFITGSLQAIQGAPVLSNKAYRFISYYTNAAYSFQEKYVLSLSSRRDGSNIFGANTNDKWKPLWSYGFSWKLSKETFYNFGLIPDLSFRATYGFSGNVDLSKTALPEARTSGVNTANFPRIQITNINNPELKWEKVGIYNIGVDFSFKNQIITGSLEYYHKKGNDLYGSTPYDYTAWGELAFITKNVANMTADGVDIVLNTINVDKALKWNTNILFNYNSSKTTAYFTPSATQVSSYLGGSNSIFPVVGKPLYGLAAFKWGGLNNLGNPQGFIDGQLSTNYSAIINEANIKGTDGNIVFFGSALPTFFGSLINTFSWKGLSLDINVAYKLGYYFRKSTISYDQLINSGISHNDYAKRWQNPGDEQFTSVPAFVYPNISNRDRFFSQSELHVLKGDHIRLQYINISYTVKKRGNSKLPFKDLQFYANASNLGILWRSNNEKLDPEYPSSILPQKLFAGGIRGSF